MLYVYTCMLGWLTVFLSLLMFRHDPFVRESSFIGRCQFSSVYPFQAMGGVATVPVK